MEERKRFYLAGATIGLGILSLLAASATLWRTGRADWALQGLAIAIAATVVTSALMLRGYRSLRTGLPLEDEMSRRLRMDAGGWTLWLSMYVWLGALLFQEHLTKDEMIGLGLGATAVIFAVAYAVLGRKGGAEQ